MKTPKREANISLFGLFAEPEKAEAKCARWKRKNRVAQLKRTIARLTKELQNERERSSFFYVAYSRIVEQLNARKGKA